MKLFKTAIGVGALVLLSACGKSATQLAEDNAKCDKVVNKVAQWISMDVEENENLAQEFAENADSRRSRAEFELQVAEKVMEKKDSWLDERDLKRVHELQQDFKQRGQNGFLAKIEVVHASEKVVAPAKPIAKAICMDDI